MDKVFYPDVTHFRNIPTLKNKKWKFCAPVVYQLLKKTILGKYIKINHKIFVSIVSSI